MSTLYRTSSMLHSMVLDGRKPTVKDIAAEKGLPEEILKRTLEDINRHLDYMRGFKPLAQWFDHSVQTSSAPYYGAPLEEWFVEAELAGKYPHCICVADMTMGDGMNVIIPSEKGRYKKEYRHGYREDAQRVAWLRVFLTRKMEWIIWASWPTSVFRFASDMESMLEAVEELRPERMPLRCYGRAGHLTDTDVQSVPILVTAELELHLMRSFTEKREDAEREEATLAKIRKRTTVYSGNL